MSLGLCRCFEVFRVIHKLVDTEEDILMVRPDSKQYRASFSQSVSKDIYK